MNKNNAYLLGVLDGIEMGASVLGILGKRLKTEKKITAFDLNEARKALTREFRAAAAMLDKYKEAKTAEPT